MLSPTAYQESQLAIAPPPVAALEGGEGLERSERRDQQVLITRVLHGDSDAFGDIAVQYSALMLRTAFMIVGDRDVAEDIVQDALIQAWHHLSDLREAGALRPWLMRIVINQCISFKRRLARSSAFLRQALSDLETDLLARSADLHKGSIERDWDLARAVEGLPAKQRVAIVLHYYNGMTLPEMARALQISENTLKKRIQTALANLRQILVLDGEELPAARALSERLLTSTARRPWD
jgi:RNA polymerase sigma factor (sigma-70 family)